MTGDASGNISSTVSATKIDIAVPSMTVLKGILPYIRSQAYTLPKNPVDIKRVLEIHSRCHPTGRAF